MLTPGNVYRGNYLFLRLLLPVGRAASMFAALPEPSKLPVRWHRWFVSFSWIRCLIVVMSSKAIQP